MTAPVTLEPIYGLPTYHVMLGEQSVGILIPPQTSSDAWEYWASGEWIAHRFLSQDEALAALGITQRQEQEAA